MRSLIGFTKSASSVNVCLIHSSAISSEESNHRRNTFISFANSFMSAPALMNPAEKAINANKKMGIENLEEFTIFPKEKIDGKTVITA